MTNIETERLWLRRSTPETYKEVWEHYTRPGIKAFFGHETDEELEADRLKFTGGLTTFRTSFVAFHLIEKKSNRVIGDCVFHTWYLLHSRAEIGYMLRKEEDRNKGYMKEAILPIIRYGFDTMNLNRIEAFISPGNIPSQKLVRSMGFVQEGLLREHYRKNDVLEDSLIFGLLRKEFNQ